MVRVHYRELGLCVLVPCYHGIALLYVPRLVPKVGVKRYMLHRGRPIVTIYQHPDKERFSCPDLDSRLGRVYMVVKLKANTVD